MVVDCWWVGFGVLVCFIIFGFGLVLVVVVWVLVGCWLVVFRFWCFYFYYIVLRGWLGCGFGFCVGLGVFCC